MRTMSNNYSQHHYFYSTPAEMALLSLIRKDSAFKIEIFTQMQTQSNSHRWRMSDGVHLLLTLENMTEDLNHS